MSLQEFFRMPLTISIEDLKNLFTIVAIVVGGFWTYFTFFRGRTFQNRLELNCAGEISVLGGEPLLLLDVTLKNVGLSKTEISQKGTAIIVNEFGLGEVNNAVEALRKQLLVLPILEEHGWIEPGERIEDKKLVHLPKRNPFAYEIEVRVVVPRRRGDGLTWSARDIVLSQSSTNLKG